MGWAKNRFYKYHLPVYVWAACIFLVSSLSLAQLPAPGPSDKIAHLIEYAVLGFLLVRALQQSESKTTRNHALSLTLAIGILYGLSDEVHQIFVPLREFEILDILADAVGCIAGGACRQALSR